jgi:hypothetical protein
VPLPAETPANAPPEAPAPSLTVEERKQELAVLKRRLADLRARYDATRRRESDLKQTLAAVELNLEIQSAERRVVELRRADAALEAARARVDRDAAAKAAAGLRQDLAVRMAASTGSGGRVFRPLAAADSGRSGSRCWLTCPARR